MVGIVIVSHSAKLAEGVRELVDQMVQGKVPIAVAGGIDDPEQPIGTDAMKVLESIESVYSEDGVVVFMDLGSALLSAETALEFLEPEQREHIYLTSAPLIEGVMAGAVQASIGATAQQVIAEAQGSLLFKADQLGEPLPSTTQPDSIETGPDTSDTEVITLVIPNRLGLHARPAARFVATAGQFAADIRVTRGNRSANAKSLNQIALLGARQGDEIRIAASGPDAAAALAALRQLADDNFGDKVEEGLGDVAAEPTSTASEVVDKGVLTGIAASPGVAVGPAALYKPSLPPVERDHRADSDQEWARLESAVRQALDDLEAVAEQASRQVGATEAAIFEAHALMMRDPELLEAVESVLRAEQINAEAAWQEIIQDTAAGYRALDDAYMQARAADVEDVGRRVLQHLLELEPPSLIFDEPSILVAADLSPSDTARLDPQQVLGICTSAGGATAHSAILARGLGIPAVVGAGEALWTISDRQQIALDGTSGQIWLEPTEADLARFRAERTQWQEKQDALRRASQAPAVTQDGRTIEIAANIGGPRDVPTALAYGAEGVGLFRTEFLFLDRDEAPTEEEQYEAYRQAADELGAHPLIIRTLDVGGDKPLPYLDLGEEENPFLGWRGVRFCLDNPDLFKSQLRAILRAGADRSVKMMFPMIGTVREVRAAKRLVAEVKEELAQEGIKHDGAMDLGIMIEVPAAAAVADLLAAEVDFFSIGTNDLTQYTMAADRGNSHVANLARAFDPAVLRLIDQTVRAAHGAGIWVGMCGELAGNDLATPLLVGLGLDELSMSAPSIPAVKAAIRKLNLADAQDIAEKALKLETADAVADFLTATQP